MRPGISITFPRHCFLLKRYTHKLKTSLRVFSMNCPSKTDEDILLNPTWNQNPPRFASDPKTLRSGPKSISREGEAIDCGAWEGCRGSSKWCRCAVLCVLETEKLTLKLGPCTQSITISRIYDQAGASTADQILPWTTLRSWACWILSVLGTSMAMSFLSGERTWSNTAAKVATSSKNLRLTNMYNA